MSGETNTDAVSSTNGVSNTGAASITGAASNTDAVAGPAGGRKMRLGAFVMATGHHVAAWRHPGSQVDSGTNIDHYVEVARIAERGLFDQLFVADSPGQRHEGDREALSR